MSKKCALFALASGVVIGYVAAKYGDSIKNTVRGHFEKKSVEALADEIKKTVDMKGKDFSEYLKNVKVKRESDISSADTEVDGVSVEEGYKPKYIDITFADLKKKFEEEDRAKEVAQILHGTAKEGKAVLMDAIRKFKEMDSGKSSEEIVDEIKADIEANSDSEDESVCACNPEHRAFVMTKEQFDKVNSEKSDSKVVVSEEVKSIMDNIVDETSTSVKKGTSKKKTSSKKSEEKKSEDK